MSILTVSTPFNIDLEFRIAPFLKRVGATLLDMLVISAYSYIVFAFIVNPLNLTEEWGETTLIVLIAIPCFLYHLVTELFLNGQSVGKRLVGIKVMDKNGNEPTLSQYLIRWVLGLSNYILSAVPYVIYLVILSGGAYIFAFIFIFMFYLPDVLCVAVSKKSQRLGDLAAGTVVIDQRAGTGLEDTIYLEIEDDNYKVQYPQVMRLSDRDINGIRNLLGMKNNSRDIDTYTIDVAHRIKEVLVIESDLPPRDFLHQLLQDYNYLTSK